MAVWNTIDDRYSVFFSSYRNEVTILDFSPFQNIFSMTVRFTIDVSYCNFVLSIYLFYCCRFESIFSMTVWNTIDDKILHFFHYIYLHVLKANKNATSIYNLTLYLMHFEHCYQVKTRIYGCDIKAVSFLC